MGPPTALQPSRIKKSCLWRVGGRVPGGTLRLWGGGMHPPKCLFSSVCEAAAIWRISIFTKTPPTTATHSAPCCDEGARRDGAGPAAAAAAAATASADTKGANRGCETLYGQHKKKKKLPTRPPTPLRHLLPPRALHARPRSPPYTLPPWSAPLMAPLPQVYITRAGGQHGGAVRR